MMCVAIVIYIIVRYCLRGNTSFFFGKIVAYCMMSWQTCVRIYRITSNMVPL